VADSLGLHPRDAEQLEHDVLSALQPLSRASIGA